MAEWSGCFGSDFDVTNGDFVPTIKCLEDVFRNVLGAVVAFISVGLFVMLIVGGYSLLFSGGDQKKLQMAKGTISTAIVGLVVIVSAYLIIRIIETFVGISTPLTTFEIKILE